MNGFWPQLFPASIQLFWLSGIMYNRALSFIKQNVLKMNRNKLSSEVEQITGMMEMF
jgi:hypothetical protein